MSSFKTACYKIIADNLIGDAVDQWNAMYHNASISWWPDDIDDRWEEWYEWLEIQSHFLCDNIKEQLKENFDFNWKIYQFGRGGATISPDPDVIFPTNYYRNWPKIEFDDLIRSTGYEESERLQEDFGENDPDVADAWYDTAIVAKDYLAAFKLVNEIVKNAVDSIKDEWEEFSNAQNI